MGLSRPFQLMLIQLLLALSGLSSAFAQVPGVFSNTYEFSDDLYESNPGQLEVLWRARIYGESVSLDTQSAEVGGADIYADSKYQLLESTEARLFLRAKFESGRSQSFFGDIEPNTGLLVREAAIKTSPLKVISVKAGVITQDWLEMPLFTYRQSFPGGLVDLHYNEFETFKFGYAAQYVIPTSQTLSARTSDREPSPSLVTHTLYGNLAIGSTNIYGSANTYEYKKLPSQVAFDSFLTGNSVSDAVICGPNSCEFGNEFKGWFTRIGASSRINAVLEPSIEYSVIKNPKAPETMNDGSFLRLASKFHMTNYAVTAAFDSYFAEADVVPSYYNAWALGNTNKKGNGGELILEFKKKNFRIRAQYYEAHLINFNNIQEDQQYFFLGVETGYDKI